LPIASHNVKIIKYLEKIKREGSSKGTIGSLEEGASGGNLWFPGIYLQCGGLKNKICIFIINNGSH
jgi:hypothetical protein